MLKSELRKATRETKSHFAQEKFDEMAFYIPENLKRHLRFAAEHTIMLYHSMHY